MAGRSKFVLMRAKLFPLLLLIFLPLNRADACELWAVISNSLNEKICQDSLLVRSELNFLQSEPTVTYNNDGWALLYYRIGETEPDTTTQLWRSPLSAEVDSLFNIAADSLLVPTNSAGTAQGHIRNASSGAEDIPDPHPFLYQWGEQLLSFSHNGSLNKESLLDLLTDFGTDSSWILVHPPDTYGCGNWQGDGWDCVIDSQLYFFWLVKNIESSGDILTGLQDGIALIDDPVNGDSYLTGAKNFTLTGGHALYAYRSAMGEYSHKLYYSDANVPLVEPYSEITQHHQAVMTKPPTTGPASAMDWVWMDNGTLIRLSRGEDPLIITGLGNDIQLGDLNEDDAVDILDVIWLVFLIINDQDPSEYELMAGDVNLDSYLDVVDVTWLVNIILYT